MPAAECAPSEIQSLYSEHHGWLRDWLRRKLGDSFAAADLAQDTFITLLTGETAGEIRQPRPFLVTIARRLASHRHRSQILEASYLDALACMPEPTAPSPEAQLLAVEALHEIDRALGDLPPAVKEAFLLAHLEECSYAEIAQHLGVSMSSVKQYLSRANRQCLFALAA